MFTIHRCFTLFTSAAISATCILLTANAPARATQQLVSSNISFTTEDQSMWDSGEAFIFDYLDFFGIDPAPNAGHYVNPAPVSGGSAPFSHWTVDPFFRFRTDFKLGMELGAKINSGSIDANLDYHVALEAPDNLVQGEPFSLTGSATKQGTSSFQSSPPNAEAWVDGVVQADLRGYARIQTSGSDAVFGTHDYRMGREGFTDGSTTNLPWRNLVNVNYKPELVGLNRNGSHQFTVLGRDQIDHVYEAGDFTTITAGTWLVEATGDLDGDMVRGSGEETLVTASVDIDYMATTAAGLPPLGHGESKDWGRLAFDVGYEVLDVKAELALGLKQSFSIASDVLTHLQFSEAVIVEGIGETHSYLGPLDAIPEITLLSDSVTVDPKYMIAAELVNDTALTVTQSLPITLFEGHANVSWDVPAIPLISPRITGNKRVGFGPIYQATPSNTDAISVYTNQFELGGFETIVGDSFLLSTGVPGDFDEDGDVDGGDFLSWQRNTEVGELSDWQNSYGTEQNSLAASSASIPEPSAILLIVGMVLIGDLSRVSACVIRKK